MASRTKRKHSPDSDQIHGCRRSSRISSSCAAKLPCYSPFEHETEVTGKISKADTPKQKQRAPKTSARKGKRDSNIKKESGDTDAIGDDATVNVGLTTAAAEMANSHKKFVGAHTSIAGGLHNAVIEAVDMGAKAFGLFLKSQRQWQAKPLDDGAAETFKRVYQEHHFSPDHIVPHGSYLMNCGSPKADMLQKSRDALIDELKRCEKLGLTLFNFHPGSTCGEGTVEECIEKIAQSINIAHAQTKYVVAVIENMSCQGNTVGGRFSELRAIIDQVTDKKRVGVCLDTCHAFAAGYDLRSKEGYEKMMSEFDTVVGMDYLKAIHLNDSKGELGCHLDRHENIGKGKIGKAAFERMMQDPRFNNIPFILETPLGDYAREIKLLNSMCKAVK